MHRSLRAVAAVAFLSSGCYFHRPIVGTPEPNTDVTVTLTNDASNGTSNALGPDARALDGRVVTSARDTIVVAVRRMRRAGGRVEQWKSEHVALPSRDLARVEQRRFAPLPTAGVVAVTVTGLVLVVTAADRAAKRTPVLQ